MINKDPLEYNNSIAHILKDMAAPLLQTYNITTFSYLRFFKNGQIMHISNQEKWLEHYIKTELYNDTNRYTREIRMVQRGEKNVFLRIPTSNYSFEKIMNDFGLCYGISIYQQCDDYIEMYGFATNISDPSIIEVYINNIKFLKRFAVSFKDKGKGLISPVNKMKLIVPDLPPQWGSLQPSRETQHKFLIDTTVKRFHISSKNFLSFREAQALYYRLSGNSAKDIAKEMSVSPRTIETHLNKVKLKFEAAFGNSFSFKKASQKNCLNSIMEYFECEKL